ncbi:MAG: polysaccharide biosynthesis/export family protein [Deltaproteobacteria bacterium]|nr:polysaccharide biosynthesis/export family protein [Deltaproteobacteria bacterium]
MRTFSAFILVIALALSLFISACGGVAGGDVVRVTTVKKNSPKGLGEADLAKLEEIKKTRKNQGVDPGLNNVIKGTPHFSASEYLSQHPRDKGAAGSDYTVGGYDVLNIIVYEEKDLSREAIRVSGEGYISFPLIGRLKVDDLTTSEIEDLISRNLAEEQYLLDAHVSVMVTGYNSKRYLVLGAVETPGSYPLQAQERVLDAVSRAEGIVADQAGKHGMIIRTENPGTKQEHKLIIDLDLQGLLKGRDQVSNLYLVDKDVLFIPKAEHFYIIGQVKSPGSYPLTDREITLIEAISMAEGFTPIASRNKTRIIRIENGVEKIIQVQVDAITDAGKKIQDVLIQANDIIVVPESFF